MSKPFFVLKSVQYSAVTTKMLEKRELDELSLNLELGIGAQEEISGEKEAKVVSEEKEGKIKKCCGMFAWTTCPYSIYES